MIKPNKTEKDFTSRKEYLVYLAILYIESHTGYVGIDDDIFYDEAECSGDVLAYDLAAEFNIEVGE